MRGLGVALAVCICILILPLIFTACSDNSLSADGAKIETPEVKTMASILKISSPAFSHNGKIPSKYTCQGQDINPPLEIAGIPEDAKSLVLIMDDPDAPVGV